MKKAKLFKIGNNQAIKLPKEYRFNCSEVSINKIGDSVIIVPKKSKCESFSEAIDMFSDDFMKDGRNLEV